MSTSLPRANADTQPFWEGCAAGEIRYQACGRCAAVQLIPRSLCAHCQHDALQWKTSRGLGRILSHTTVHRAPTPEFRAQVPYVVALIDMDEGFRLMVNVEQAGGRQAEIGRAVRIGFRESTGIRLPYAELLA